MAEELDGRIRSLELANAKLETTAKLSLGFASIFGLLVIGWLGLTNFYSVPKAIEKAISDAGATEVVKKLDQIVQESEAKAAMISTFGNGTITVGDQCFKPRMLYRCFLPGDRIVWIDNIAACQNAGYNIEDQVAILAAC